MSHDTPEMFELLPTCPKSGSLAAMPTDDSRDVGAEVRAEMGRQRVSMVNLADRTGIARTTLAYQINSGRLTVETLMAIAKALDVPLSSLVSEDVA